jgi:hypothetical protein
MRKDKTPSDEMDGILADAQRGDETSRQRARVFAYETYPSFFMAADRERFFHQIEAFLNTRS